MKVSSSNPSGELLKFKFVIILYTRGCLLHAFFLYFDQNLYLHGAIIIPVTFFILLEGRVIFHRHSFSRCGQIADEARGSSEVQFIFKQFSMRGLNEKESGCNPMKLPRILYLMCVQATQHIVYDRIHHCSQQIHLQLIYRFIYFIVDSHIVVVKHSKTNIF